MDTKVFIQDLLLSTLALNATYLSPPYNHGGQLDYHLRELIWKDYDYEKYAYTYIKEVKDKTIYFTKDTFEAHYVVMKLLDSEEFLCIGPYLTQEPNEPFCLKVIECNNLTKNTVPLFADFYNKLPILSTATVMATANTIATYLYDNQRDYNIEYLSNSDVPDPQLEFTPNPDSAAFIKSIEELYEMESALLQAVAKGDRKNALLYLHALHSVSFKPRSSEPLRDLKNRFITLNTLYRKAVEQNYIHPIYLDEISTRYAIRIEHLTNQQQFDDLFIEMTRKYCLLVKNYSLKEYSPLIQSTLNYIHLNLSSPLSLKVIADYIKVSSSYLSSQFKKEMHMTLTQYILTQRINTSIKLLNTTNMQIQNIAWYVGINDVNYFARLFKKQTGLTPSEYRNQILKND